MADALPAPQLPGPQTAGQGDTAEPRKKREGYKPSKAAEKIIKRVSERRAYSRRPASRWALERQMFENIAFLNGIQWIEYSEQTRRFSKWNAPAWFPTPVDNQVEPRLLGMQARLLKSNPTGRVRPNKNEAKDREGARVAEQIASHIDDVVHEEELRDKAALYAGATGTVIFHDRRNPEARPVMMIPLQQAVDQPIQQDRAVCPQCQRQFPPELAGTPCPQCQQTQLQQPELPGQQPVAPPVPELQAQQMPAFLSNGEPAMETVMQPELDANGQPVIEQHHQGELESQAFMLFNFYWDPKARELREARWCGELCYSDLDWIDQNFPDLGPYVDLEAGVDASSFYEASLTALVGPSIQGTAHYGGGQNFEHGAVVRSYQEKPSRDYPNGIWAIVANGVLLYPPESPDGSVETALPIKDLEGNPTGDFSYTEFRYDMVPGRFPGRSPVDDMVPLQRKVNAIDAQLILNRKTLLNPWVLAPKGSGLVPGQVAMRPAATVVYNYVGIGVAPQVVKGEPLPAQILEERKEAMASMDRLAQDQRSGGAEMPPGTKSGIALNFLREQKEEDSTPRLRRWARCMSERKRKQLLLVQQHYREPRAIKLVGPGQQWQVHYWQGSDLAGNTDVSIDPGTIIPRSPSVKTQLLFDAAEQGLVNLQDPLQKQKALDYLDLTEFETEIGPDVRRALKENAEMDEGKPVEINENDNDEIHLLEHIPKIKDPGFDYLSPPARQAHLKHKAMHMQRLLQKKMQEMKGQMGAPPAGGPPGKGGPPHAGKGGPPPAKGGGGPPGKGGQAAAA